MAESQLNPVEDGLRESLEESASGSQLPPKTQPKASQPRDKASQYIKSLRRKSSPTSTRAVGRPKTGQAAPGVSVKIPPDLYKQLRVIADTTAGSIQWVLNRALTQWLQAHAVTQRDEVYQLHHKISQLKQQLLLIARAQLESDPQAAIGYSEFELNKGAAQLLQEAASSPAVLRPREATAVEQGQMGLLNRL